MSAIQVAETMDLDLYGAARLERACKKTGIPAEIIAKNALRDFLNRQGCDNLRLVVRRPRAPVHA